MKRLCVVVVFLDARADRKNIGIEDNVLGRKADLLSKDAVGALADLNFRSYVSACPRSSNAMTMTAAP